MQNLCIDCVYLKACEGSRRKIQKNADCHVPESPLRMLQGNIMSSIVFNVKDYANITVSYIEDIKAKSHYWTKLKNTHWNKENSK